MILATQKQLKCFLDFVEYNISQIPKENTLINLRKAAIYKDLLHKTQKIYLSGMQTSKYRLDTQKRLTVPEKTFIVEDFQNNIDVDDYSLAIIGKIVSEIAEDLINSKLLTS